MVMPVGIKITVDLLIYNSAERTGQYFAAGFSKRADQWLPGMIAMEGLQGMLCRMKVCLHNRQIRFVCIKIKGTITRLIIVYSLQKFKNAFR